MKHVEMSMSKINIREKSLNRKIHTYVSTLANSEKEKKKKDVKEKRKKKKWE